MFVARLEYAHVLVDDRLALMRESVRQHGGGDVKLHPQQEKQRAQGHRILHDGRHRAERLHQLGDRQRHGHHVILHRNIHAQLVGIEQNRAARLDLRGVPLDRILVQGNQRIEVIALRVNFFLSHAQLEPDVAAANHRLVAVESIGVQPGARGRLRQGVGRFVDAVSGGASNSYGYFVHLADLRIVTRLPRLIKLRIFDSSRKTNRPPAWNSAKNRNDR